MGKFETLVLYITLFIITLVTSALSQQRIVKISDTGKKEYHIKFNKIWFFITFFVLWFFYALSDISYDYYNYVRVFNTVEWVDLFSWRMESGYELLNLIIRLFTNNGNIAMTLIKSLIIMLYFSVLYTFRNKIHITISIIAFYSISYLSSFNLISMHLAAALCLIAFKNVYFKKNKQAIIYFLLAFSIHYTAFFMLIIYLYYSYFHINIKRILSLKNIMLIVALVVIFLSVMPIYEYLTSNILFLYKYRVYNIKDDGIGFVQFAYYLPIFILLYKSYHVCKDKELINISMVLTVFGFFFAMLGYYFNVIDRMFVYFVFPYFIFVPYYMNELRLKNIIFRNSRRRMLGLGVMYIMMLSYYISRWAIYANIYLNLSGLDSFYFFWMR